MSTCPKCSKHEFEIVEANPAKATEPVSFVQCADCGTVVGVLEQHPVGGLVLRLSTAVKKIAEKLGVPVNLPK